MSKKILFADDEPIYIEGLIEKAKAEGYDVILCDNASEAIKLTDNGDIECLLIDIMMDPGPDLKNVKPHQAGLEAIRIIRNKNPHQPIVCMSVISDSKIINALKKKNVQYLRKGEISLRTAWRLVESKITGVTRVI